MKKAAIVLMFYLGFFLSSCMDHNLEPTPERTSVWQAGGPGIDIGEDIAVDGSGNVYVIGTFGRSATFGSITLTSGSVDVFVVKYNSSGEVLWIQQANGTAGAFGYGIAVDGSGNVYVTGSFDGAVTFGTTTLTSTGFTDVFVAKYNSSGEVQWAQKAGGAAYDSGADIAVDGSGNVYLTGGFNESATFGTTTLTSTGSSDAFIVKYNSSGIVQWAQQIGGPAPAIGGNIAVDGGGNVYVTGPFQETVRIGTISLTANSNNDVFIAKYNSNGDVQWAKKAGEAEIDNVSGIGVDASGNVYIGGNFYSTITFESTTLNSSGSFDMYIAKYNSNGELQWAQRAGGTSSDELFDLTVDESSNFYITGRTGRMFVAKYNSNGEAQWVRTNNELLAGRGIAVDGSGTVFVTGTTPILANMEDIFVAKYGN